MDHILYQIFMIIFEFIIKKHQKVTDHPPIRIYVNQVENGLTSRIKIGYYLKLLTPKTMKLFRSIKSKITKDGNGENMPRLEIAEVVLVHCNIVNNGFQQG